MRPVTYLDIARKIAAAETPEERKECEALLAAYYAFGARETTRERIAALKRALLEAGYTADSVNPERDPA